MKLDYAQHQRREAKQHKRFGSYEPVPDGLYRVWVHDLYEKTPKAGGQNYLSVTLKVKDGEHAGRLLWDTFVIYHDNEEARTISRARLDALAQACGVYPLRDTDHLYGRECSAKVTIKEDPGYPPKNKVVGYPAPEKAPGAEDKPREPANDQKPAERMETPELDDDIPF